MTFKQIISAILLVAATASPVLAQEPARLILGSGVTGFARHNDHVRKTAEYLSFEYRSTNELFHPLRLLAGGFASSNGAAYVHVGLYYDFNLAQRWILTPHFSAGAFTRRDGMDLGDALEFQSGFDLFYRLDNGWRVGATLRHVSNAGLAKINPGTENLGIVFAVPFR